MKARFPYSIEVKRTRDWYDVGGQEYRIRDWCYTNIGSNIEWECTANIFFFKEEHYKLHFKLRWGDFCVKDNK